MQACCVAGCVVGTALVQVLGAELSFGKWEELSREVNDVVERLGGGEAGGSRRE